MDRIGRLDLLRGVYGSILVPPSVGREVGPSLRQDWIVERRPPAGLNRRAVAARLHAGETEAISLALHVDARQVVLDDGPARRVAEALDLVVVGTAGVLLIAKRLGIVPNVEPILDQLLASGFRLRPEVVRYVLVQADETV